MSLWPENEFQRIALSTKLSARTVAACRDVLVADVAGVDAALTHQMFPAQISRALKVLRDRRAEMSRSAETLKDEGALLKYTAAKVAKSVAGEGLSISDAQPGRSYDGKVIVITHGFMVQQAGRSGVMHDLGNLDKSPTLNTSLTISYPLDGGRAMVNENKLPEKQARDVGR